MTLIVTVMENSGAGTPSGYSAVKISVVDIAVVRSVVSLAFSMSIETPADWAGSLEYL